VSDAEGRGDSRFPARVARIASVGARERATGVLFGDSAGVALFLGAVICYVAAWRIGFLISDSTTVANTLANVAEGRLAIVETPYSLTMGSQPGAIEVGGRTFGRNYGHVLAALPVLWVFELLGTVADPRVLLAGGWSLLVVGFASQIARLTDTELISTVGATVAVVLFAGNLATGEPLPRELLPLMALQVTTMVAAGLAATTVYRLVARVQGRRVGLAAGSAVVLATPLSFWASIPKRHVLTAAAAVVVVYCFAVSRDSTDTRAVWARRGAYATLGLLTTVHAFEAFFLFVVFVPLDLLTAPTNDLRTLGAIGAVFAAALVPLFVINGLVTGNPLKSPRFAGGVPFDVTIPSGEGGSGADAGTGTETPADRAGGGSTETPEATPDQRTPGTDPGSPPTATEPGERTTTATDRGTDRPAADGTANGGPVGAVVGSVVGFLAFAGTIPVVAWEFLLSGLEAATDPDRLYHTFVRSGYIPELDNRTNAFEAVDLTVLESFPLAAALAWLPVAALRNARAGLDRAGLGTVRRQTDALAAGFVAIFVVIYMPRLPLHSQITVRYLVPIVPLVVYGVARLEPVRRAVQQSPRWLVTGYATTVVVVGVGTVGGFVALDPAIGEAMQLHALIGLAAAAVTVASVGVWPLQADPRLSALALAVAGGTTTAFLLATGFEYFQYRVPGNPYAGEPFALGLVRVLAESVPLF